MLTCRNPRSSIASAPWLSLPPKMRRMPATTRRRRRCRSRTTATRQRKELGKVDLCGWGADSVEGKDGGRDKEFCLDVLDKKNSLFSWLEGRTYTCQIWAGADFALLMSMMLVNRTGLANIFFVREVCCIHFTQRISIVLCLACSASLWSLVCLLLV